MACVIFAVRIVIRHAAEALTFPRVRAVTEAAAPSPFPRLYRDTVTTPRLPLPCYRHD